VITIADLRDHDAPILAITMGGIRSGDAGVQVEPVSVDGAAAWQCVLGGVLLAAGLIAKNAHGSTLHRDGRARVERRDGLSARPRAGGLSPR